MKEKSLSTEAKFQWVENTLIERAKSVRLCRWLDESQIRASVREELLSTLRDLDKHGLPPGEGTLESQVGAYLFKRVGARLCREDTDALIKLRMQWCKVAPGPYGSN